MIIFIKIIVINNTNDIIKTITAIEEPEIFISKIRHIYKKTALVTERLFHTFKILNPILRKALML